jgi:heat-inducible transcriptional repressor
MIDLTPRQIQILRAVIKEFIETAEPVGSDTVDKKYNIGVSPATIRNEMVYLSKQNYLYKTHASGGRVPTPIALKLYVNELMKEQELSVADEVSAKEKIWSSRNQLEQLLQESTRVLASRARALGLALTDNYRLYHSGYSNLLDMPEFYDIEVMRKVLNLIEEARQIEEIFRHGESADKVHVVYGREINKDELDSIGLVYITIQAHGHHCRLGVLGSERFNYPYLVPLMKYFKSLIEDIV